MRESKWVRMVMSVLRIFGLHGRSASSYARRPLSIGPWGSVLSDSPAQNGFGFPRQYHFTGEWGRGVSLSLPLLTGLEAHMCPASCIAYWLKAAGLTKSTLLQMASYLSGLASLQGAHRGKRGADPEEEGAQGNEEL